MDSNKAPLARRLVQLHRDLVEDTSGEVATYIPELGQADPTSFGLSIVTANAQTYDAGLSQTPFSIQSISKPFVYAMALIDVGKAAVLDRVGIEPTGDPFNAVTLSEDTGRPLNPMVNAGAIVTSSLVEGANAEERTRRIVAGLSAFAGRELSMDDSVRSSEFNTSDRNRAISYLMRGSGALKVGVEDALESYISQCSVLVTVRDLATMCATLAAGGVNPLTGEQVVPPTLIDPVLSIMSTCGMYDGAGAWMYRVGLPAKSGVSGGVIAALPNQLGIASWSPPLDPHGNSVRGVRAMETLSEDLDLHIFSPTGSANSPVRRQTSSRVIRSRSGRPLAERSVLESSGDSIRIIELGGAIGLLAAQTVVDILGEFLVDAGVGWLVLDARGVGYLHPGALKIINEELQSLASRGKVILVVDRPQNCTGAPGARWATTTMPILDSALQRCEDALIVQELGAAASREITVPIEECDVLRDLEAADVGVLRPGMREIRVSAGAALTDDGAAIRGLLWVVRGEVEVFADLQGRRTRLQGVGPGGLSGVMTTVDDRHVPRESVAVTDATIMLLDGEQLGRLTADEPAVMVSLLRAVAQTMLVQQRSAQEILASLSSSAAEDLLTSS